MTLKYLYKIQYRFFGFLKEIKVECDSELKDFRFFQEVVKLIHPSEEDKLSEVCIVKREPIYSI